MTAIKTNILSKKIKKERLKINNLNDFKNALKEEGYEIDDCNEEDFKYEIASYFDVDNSIVDNLFTCLIKEEIVYRSNNIRELFDYIKKITIFESEHDRLCKEISEIKTLIIDRVEYERIPNAQENVDNLLKEIEKISNKISGIMSEEDKVKLEELEEEIDKYYVYAKDVELLKKMILSKKEVVDEAYNSQSRVKTISINIPDKINYEYIKSKKGSVEYYQYLNKNIPRMKRLIKNINKYIKVEEKENSIFKINQSEALQDSINIAVATFNRREFRAISGSNEISDYCKSPQRDKATFKSRKVNKLGQLGIGYDRVNDSEKKIFEEIHKHIENKTLKNHGNLVLYSKWEPCPSCYLVINQFCKKHPDINVQVKYIKKYGA